MTVAQLIPTSWLGVIPNWILIFLAILFYGVPVIILSDNLRMSLCKWLRFTPPTIGWNHIALLLAIVVLVQSSIIYSAPIFYVADWSKNQLAASFDFIYDSSASLFAWVWGLLPDRPERPKRTVDHLLTRPICESDCENFDFIVRDCERKAVEVGGLAVGRRERYGDVEEATTYFRDCLIAQGLNWETCERGEPDCRLLKSFRDRGGGLPSFLFR